MTATTHQWAPDFLELAGPEHEHDGASFDCSTTLHGVTGSLCLSSGVLVLGGSEPSVSLRARDISSWWDTPTGGTFSLAIESGARHSIVLLSQFRGATVHAMTQAFGPRTRREGLSA
ncbi:hypothetical protein [Rathayibacter sp. VKM Ac-2760]|uniref:hypothetical protein n=1 Tax=Rathayibacter sp. VKM Ac-2760 TaxID=2609253 RepID=UPI0013190525|nr:hypothetical protein [Rathayibacter sp. VKM Ac-2760]QHC60270.1 hypothetical protein GSU72_18210 [Rathayibacter sp. VKM Ac-2760]